MLACESCNVLILCADVLFQPEDPFSGMVPSLSPPAPPESVQAPAAPEVPPPAAQTAPLTPVLWKHIGEPATSPGIVFPGIHVDGPSLFFCLSSTL